LEYDFKLSYGFPFIKFIYQNLNNIYLEKDSMHQEFDFQEKCKEKFIIREILFDANDCPELF